MSRGNVSGMGAWTEYRDYAGTCGTCGGDLQMRIEKFDSWQGQADGAVRARVVECATDPEHRVKPD